MSLSWNFLRLVQKGGGVAVPGAHVQNKSLIWKKNTYQLVSKKNYGKIKNIFNTIPKKKIINHWTEHVKNTVSLSWNSMQQVQNSCR